MKKIESHRIVELLHSLGVDFHAVGKLLEDYYFASLFQPVEGGFYFSTQSIAPLTKNALVLVNSIPRSIDSTHCFLVTQRNVQVVYYRLLNSVFAPSKKSSIHPTALIDGEAIIGNNVSIGAYCIVGKCQLGDNVTLGNSCQIDDDVIIGRDTQIEEGAIIGARGIAWAWDEETSERVVCVQIGGVRIGRSCIIGAHCTVTRGSLNENTSIGDGVFIAPGCNLGHGTTIGEFSHLANNVATGGNTRIGAYGFVGSSAVFRPKTRVHEHVVVAAGAVVVKDSSREKILLVGNPARERPLKPNLSGVPFQTRGKRT